jgi:dihydrofolate reductase
MSAPRPTEVVLIAAMAANRVIGKDNRLLWHLPEDMKHFKALTHGYPVIMGRKTWESLPEKFRPLPGRQNIVISRNARFAAPGAALVGSLDAALALCAAAERAFVIGGAEIYALAMPLADRMELTELDPEFDGDARFPEWDAAQWHLVAREPRQSENGSRFAFSRYERQR